MNKLHNDVTHFNEIFKTYKEQFTLFAKSYIRDSAVAEDIYMESMVVYWEKHNTLPSDTNIPAYILTIVKNKSLNYLRHLHIQREAEEMLYSHSQRELDLRISTLEACEPTELFLNDIKKIVMITLDALPQKTREVFMMSRNTDLTNQEIAWKMGISVKGVEFHINKALKVFRVELKDYLSLLALIFPFSI